MSIEAPCPGCMSGKHEEHQRDWNLTPGLIGGSWCGCPGEPLCTERFERFTAIIREEMGLVVTSDVVAAALRAGREGEQG